MDLNHIIATALTFLAGIGVVGVFIKKYAVKAGKYLSIAKETLDLLDTVVKAIEDQKIDDIEVAKIREEVNALMAAIKVK
jgi:hypothetical protein